MPSNEEKNAKPFLKWAGGKKQIAKCIEKNLPPHIRKDKFIKNYIEPFLGGGAIFFYLKREKYTIENVFLSDINKDLILTFEVVRDEPDKLILQLEEHSKKFKKKGKDYYYEVREDFNLEKCDYNSSSDESILRASRMIFLNRTCFNGLYRVNKSGEFNVPIGSYKNPRICDDSNILNVSEVLQGVTIESKDFRESLKPIEKGDFFYLDPPYLPVKQNSFTSYTSEDFGMEEQIKLSEFCKEIDKKDAYFLLSNSSPESNFFSETYGKLDLKKCDFKRIDARRSINSKGDKRGAVKELLIFNY